MNSTYEELHSYYVCVLELFLQAMHICLCKSSFDFQTDADIAEGTSFAPTLFYLY